VGESGNSLKTQCLQQKVKGLSKMFAGRYIHKIDNKGRLALPTRLRDAGKGTTYSQFVVTKGIGGCISVFTIEKFENFLNEFDASNLSEEQGLNFYREFASWAHYLDVDAQGRINLPQILMDEVGLTEEVLVLGVVDWIEIWNGEKYAQHLEKSNTNYDEAAMRFFSSAMRGKRKKADEQQS
jgi:MraZ protein